MAPDMAKAQLLSGSSPTSLQTKSSVNDFGATIGFRNASSDKLKQVHTDPASKNFLENSSLKQSISLEAPKQSTYTFHKHHAHRCILNNT
jgi:hypothetical protein